MTFFTRLVLSLLGMAFAVVIAIGVLCWLALYVAFAAVRWLLTGQKPQVLMMWQQIQALRKGFQAGQGARWASWTQSDNGQWHEVHTEQRHQTGVVVEDVVVREIHAPRRLPKD